LAVAPYERFQAWQLSYQLVLKVYSATDAFPKHELYGLTSQARRAAFSVTLNIAEGSAKRGDGEFRRYLDSNHDWDVLERLRNHAGALTWLLYKAVSKRKRQEP